MIRSGEAPGVGWSRSMLYSGLITLPRSIVRRQTGFAARISTTLSGYIDMSKTSFRFTLRTLFLVLVLVSVLIGLVFTPATVRVPISASQIMNSIHYSVGLRINVRDGGDLIAGNCLIISRKMDVESIEINLDEIDLVELVNGNLKLPPQEDNSYLEIRVNLIQKYRIERASELRLGGLPLPHLKQNTSPDNRSLIPSRKRPVP